MNDAPEKIWAGPDMDDKGNHWENGDWDCRKGLVSPFYIEYTRADIADASEADLIKWVQHSEQT
jgi:hypothetical protein